MTEALPTTVLPLLLFLLAKGSLSNRRGSVGANVPGRHSNWQEHGRTGRRVDAADVGGCAFPTHTAESNRFGGFGKYAESHAVQALCPAADDDSQAGHAERVEALEELHHAEARRRHHALAHERIKHLSKHAWHFNSLQKLQQ